MPAFLTVTLTYLFLKSPSSSIYGSGLVLNCYILVPIFEIARRRDCSAQPPWILASYCIKSSKSAISCHSFLSCPFWNWVSRQ
jgi:hypothetical protein